MANTPCRPLLCAATWADGHVGNAECRAGCSMIGRARCVAIDWPLNRVSRFDKKTQLGATILRPFGRSSNLAHEPLTPEHPSWTKYDPGGSQSDKTNKADKQIIRVKYLPSNKKIQRFSLKRQPTQHEKTQHDTHERLAHDAVALVRVPVHHVARAVERRGGGGEHRGHRYGFAHDAQTRAERNLKGEAQKTRRKQGEEKTKQNKTAT